jgi:pyrroloquinoline quinone (PQQ) biosynthesis protein C
VNSHLLEALETTLSDRQLLSHPFYRRWEDGRLSDSELTSYAEQYRYFEAMLPVFLRELSDQLPEGLARKSVLDNLSDEVTAPSHLELFERFAQFYGASPAPLSTATKVLVDSYSQLLRQSPSAALAGLWAYESQGAKIADTKAEGLTNHYGAGTEAVAFWAAHGSIEDEHARWTLDALLALEPDVAGVQDSARLIADAWWAFLDERELVAS